ncbi:histidine phosphatase family protein [Notoacmeibacter marinus]|uniref:Histidine phosphatase family protein n=1 Tax=Notoacmeibacter marinus TaxID=1876515 RepID=A0A231UUQ1_9HYPH|nr:histidine phosphatase family protein [Notoacmeibacter marinus]OXS99550.1 histidine phosphatase family protein [Notoacmeibacter marinus]
MPQTQPIYLIRHGQTDWNAENRLQGQTDRPLNETGEAQALSNGAFLRANLSEPISDFDFVASPMLRTRQTMGLVRRGLGLPEESFQTDERLKELSFGDWESHTFAELERNDPGVSQRREADKWNFVPPGEGAESYEMLLQRVRPWFDEMMDSEKSAICVSHGGILRCAFRLFGNHSQEEAAEMAVPQDRIAVLEDGAIRWL